MGHYATVADIHQVLVSHHLGTHILATDERIEDLIVAHEAEINAALHEQGYPIVPVTAPEDILLLKRWIVRITIVDLYQERLPELPGSASAEEENSRRDHWERTLSRWENRHYRWLRDLRAGRARLLVSAPTTRQDQAMSFAMLDLGLAEDVEDNDTD
jgi:hypothetical protein